MGGRYKAYSEYKDSGVEWLGSIPKHWYTSKLKHLTKQIVDGAHFTPTYVNEGVPFLRVTDVQSKTIDKSSIKYIPQREHDELIKRCQPEKGDLLLSKNGTIGVPKIVDWDWSFSIFVSLCLIKFKPKLDAQFAYFFFLSHEIKEQIFGQIKQSTVINLHLDKIANFDLALPSVTEQKLIANFLDHETAKIDTLIEEQQSLIRLLQEKRQAVISHAVTKGLNPNAPMKDSGVEWLGEVPEHWIHNTKLMSVAEETRGSFVNGPFGSDLLSSELMLEGVPVIYIRDVKPTGYFRKSKDCVTPKKAIQLSVCSVRSGDVLVAKVGSPPGDACVYPDDQPDAIITQDVVRIRVDQKKILPEYLCYLLNSSYGRAVVDNISVESTRKRFSLGDFKQLKFPLPDIHEQRSIINKLTLQISLIDQLISEANSLSQYFSERRTALISAAVTGKIDVREWSAPELTSEQKQQTPEAAV